MTLKEWHSKLFEHFSALREWRSSVGQPVFSIEHRLTVQELGELRQTIRAHIKGCKPAHNHWLRWVVYGAEVGYEFDGHEYWDSFARKTPNWTT